MALTNFNCPAFSSPIKWFINTNGEFVLKVVNADEKAKRVRAGYVLHVANQTADSFQLVDKGSNVAGKSIDVIYQFQRAN